MFISSKRLRMLTKITQHIVLMACRVFVDAPLSSTMLLLVPLHLCQTLLKWLFLYFIHFFLFKILMRRVNGKKPSPRRVSLHHKMLSTSFSSLWFNDLYLYTIFYHPYYFYYCQYVWKLKQKSNCLCVYNRVL